MDVCAWAENLGIICDDQRRFKVTWAWRINLSHSDNGNFGSVVTSPALRWFSWVWMAFSARFLQWDCGGTSWNSVSLPLKAFFNLVEILISRTHTSGVTPAVVNNWCVCSHDSVSADAVWFFTGAPMMWSASQWYPTGVHWLPQPDATGKQPSVRFWWAIVIVSHWAMCMQLDWLSHWEWLVLESDQRCHHHLMHC